MVARGHRDVGPFDTLQSARAIAHDVSALGLGLALAVDVVTGGMGLLGAARLAPMDVGASKSYSNDPKGLWRRSRMWRASRLSIVASSIACSRRISALCSP